MPKEREVEKILDCRVGEHGGREWVEYKVRWKGHKGEDTWEKENRMQGAQDAVTTFYDKLDDFDLPTPPSMPTLAATDAPHTSPNPAEGSGATEHGPAACAIEQLQRDTSLAGEAKTLQRRVQELEGQVADLQQRLEASNTAAAAQNSGEQASTTCASTDTYVPPPATSIPVSQVLENSYELLVMVLHCLPTKDLLLAQRVCRTWRTVIGREHKLQRALFLKPAKAPMVKFYAPRRQSAHYNPEFPDGFWANNKEEKALQRAVHNPLMSDVGIIGRPKSWFYPRASWRRMYYMQPAPSRLAVRMRRHAEFATFEKVWISDDTGVKMEHFAWERCYQVQGADVLEDLVDNEQIERLGKKS